MLVVGENWLRVPRARHITPTTTALRKVRLVGTAFHRRPPLSRRWQREVRVVRITMFIVCKL